jgi:hypothetical protein
LGLDGRPRPSRGRESPQEILSKPTSNGKNKAKKITERKRAERITEPVKIKKGKKTFLATTIDETEKYLKY